MNSANAFDRSSGASSMTGLQLRSGGRPLEALRQSTRRNGGQAFWSSGCFALFSFRESTSELIGNSSWRRFFWPEDLGLGLPKRQTAALERSDDRNRVAGRVGGDVRKGRQVARLQCRVSLGRGDAGPEVKVLLTGASSFAGYRFAHALHAKGVHVVAPLRGPATGYVEGPRAARVLRLSAAADETAAWDAAPEGRR